jgi:hypothetical protein
MRAFIQQLFYPLSLQKPCRISHQAILGRSKIFVDGVEAAADRERQPATTFVLEELLVLPSAAHNQPNQTNSIR